MAGCSHAKRVGRPCPYCKPHDGPRCIDTGAPIMADVGQCGGCYLESQPNPCVAE